MPIFAMDNLIFLVPLAASVAWFSLSALLGLDAGEGDADVDADFDVDADVDADSGHPTTLATAQGHSPVLAGAYALGIGRIPVVLWLEILGVSWGTTGLAAASLGAGHWGARLLAAGVALTVTPGLSRFLQSVMPSRLETDAVSSRGCIGLLGAVTSTKVTTDYGEGTFQLEGNRGRIHLRICIEPGQRPLPEHTGVIIVEHDEVRRLFVVIEADTLLTDGVISVPTGNPRNLLSATASSARVALGRGGEDGES